MTRITTFQVLEERDGNSNFFELTASLVHADDIDAAWKTITQSMTDGKRRALLPFQSMRADTQQHAAIEDARNTGQSVLDKGTPTSTIPDTTLIPDSSVAIPALKPSGDDTAQKEGKEASSLSTSSALSSPSSLTSSKGK